MSIVRMQRIASIGLDTEKEKLMSELMDLGVVELTQSPVDSAETPWLKNGSIEENRQKITSLEANISRADQALEVIEKYGNLKSPLFFTRRITNSADLKNVLDDGEKTTFILDLASKINQATDRINKLDADTASLVPWKEYDLPLDTDGTKTVDVFTGILPVDADIDQISDRLENEAGMAVFKKCGSDKDFCYGAVISAKECSENVLAILKQYGFSRMTFKSFHGTAMENIEKSQGEKDVLKAEYENAVAQVAANARFKEDIENYVDLLTIELDKEKIKSKLLVTKKTFYLEGWIPYRYTEKASKILDENGCFYMFRDPEEDENVPVLMENKSVFVPFEAITEMYSLPDYRGVDPTSIFAFFYAMFFGMMLSDAGYGILMAVACFVALKKYNLEGNMYKMVKLLFYCGIFTIFWGAMFGGWFGDIVQVVSRTFFGKEVAIDPLWFNPVEDPMKLLIFSLALGIVHIFIGMGIKAYMQIKDGHLFDAICDEGFWYLTIIGIIAWLGGGSISAGLASAGKWMTIIGFAGLLLTGGRHNKGFGKITGGLGNVYNITSYLSDILSYARLLALGLATGIIAQVVNLMGSLLGGGVKGAIALVIIFVFGHALNLVINALGSFIHACRLQYIEFFGKFYEDGGEPFDPFRKKTRFVKIVDDEQ